MFSPKRFVRVTRSKTLHLGPRTEGAQTVQQLSAEANTTQVNVPDFKSEIIQPVNQPTCCTVSVDESDRFRKQEVNQGTVNHENGATISTKTEKNCRCSRSKCLKQYCFCFRSDRRCERDCVCVGCMNDGTHERERLIAVRHVRLNSSSAFKGLNLASNTHFITSPGGTERLYRGTCRCKKSRCQKKVM